MSSTVVRPGTAPTREGHPWLAVLPGFMAFWAWVGAAGVASGQIDFGATVTSRLPFASLPLAATALAVGVAVPMTAATVLVALRHRTAAAALVLAGVALVGWIVVEVAFIRTFSWMQPACAAWGIVTAAAGVAMPARSDRG